MGETPDTWDPPDSDRSCSESAAADVPAGGKASPPPHAASLTDGGISGGRFAARSVAVRSYPRVRSSPHLPYNFAALGGSCLVVRTTSSNLDRPKRRKTTELSGAQVEVHAAQIVSYNIAPTLHYLDTLDLLFFRCI